MSYTNDLIEITKFINPHVFWIFEKKNSTVRSSLEKDLAKISQPEITKPSIDELVLVLDLDKVWKRGLVKVVNSFGVVCWLVDYGIERKIDTVYKIPEQLTSSVYLVKQATLKDVVCVKQSFNSTSIEYVETIEFNVGSIKFFQESIQDAVSVYFAFAYKKYGTHVGEITVIKSNGTSCDLGKTMVKDKILAFNPEFFDKALKENLQLQDLNKSFEKLSTSKTMFTTEDLKTSGLGRGVSRQPKNVPGIGDQQDKKNKYESISTWAEQQAQLNDTYQEDDEIEAGSNLNDSAGSNIALSSTPVKSFNKSKIVPKITRSKADRSELLKKLSYHDSPSLVCSTENSPDDKFHSKTSNPQLNETDSSGAHDETETPNKQPAVKLNIAPAGLRSAPKKSTKVLKQPTQFNTNSTERSNAEKHDFADEKVSKPKVSLNIPPAGQRQVSSSKNSTNYQSKSQSDKVSSGSRSITSTTRPAGQRQGSSQSRSQSDKDSCGSKSITSSQPVVTNPNEATNYVKMKCVDGCKCKNCKGWSMSPLYYKHDENFIDNKTKVKETIVKPPLLLKSSVTEEVIEMKSLKLIVSGKSKTELLTIPKILVHGIHFPTPTTSQTNVPFHGVVHRSLRAYDQVYTIQSYVWPALMRHLDVCMVNPSKSGKTTAYIPCLCSFVLERNERYGNLPKNAIGPIVIVLCSGVQNAEEVFCLITKTFSHASSKPICALAVPPLDKKRLDQFQKQCEVLVTTPATLINLFNSRIISAKRLCHLVIENCDTVLNRFPKEVELLLNLVDNMLSHRSCNHNVQMIITAEHWTLPLEGLLKKLNITPVVYIGSYLEAALYGRVDIQMHFFESSRKTSTIVGLLKDTSSVCRTIVICNNDSEIEEVQELFQITGINSVFIYDVTGSQEICELESRWLNALGSTHIVLVCTDLVLTHRLNISNAVLLVHYSLPDTWTQFALRFNCLLQNYISPLVTNKEKYVRCKVHVFVDETNASQFPRLAQLLSRMGAKLNSKFRQCYKEAIQNKENENIASNVKLCRNLQLFGKCSSNAQDICETKQDLKVSFASIKCKRRHSLTPNLDTSRNLPLNGRIKFKIINVQDVTRFTVKLLEHIDLQGNKMTIDTVENLKEKLQNEMQKTRTSVFDVEVSKWYIYYCLADDTYYRCSVQKILEKEKLTKNAVTILIKLLDCGTAVKVGVESLYEIPQKFRKIPPEVVEVYLANMVPPECDDCWSLYAKDKVISLLEGGDYKKDEVYAMGQILLQLGKCLYLKNVTLHENLVLTNTIVTKLNLKRALEISNLADYCEAQLSRLYKLCESANFVLPDYNLVASSEEKNDDLEEQVKPQWAFIDDSDCVEVFINYLDTPSCFFVRLTKFYDLFRALQEDIQAAISKPFYPDEFEVEVGKCYLAKDPIGEEYCRVQVLKIMENVVHCFYVDLGDIVTINKWELKYLSNEFILRLPFQLIECRLYGIKPVFEDWNIAATDIMGHYMFEPDSDYYRVLYSNVCLKEKASTTGGDKFAILLVDNFSQKVIILNQLLIDCGEAVEKENEKLSAEFQLPNKESDEDEEKDDYVEKDLTFEELNDLVEKKAGSNNEKEAEREPDNAISMPDDDGESHTWDFEIDDSELFMKQLMGLPKESQSVKIFQNQNQQLPRITAGPSSSSDHYTPNVTWYQTTEHIKLNILIPTVLDCKTSITRERIFTFQGVYDNRTYKLSLHLYEKVNKTVQYSNSGSCIKVTLIKQKSLEWPRLIASDKKLRNIKYDVSKCSVDEQPKKPFLQIEDKTEACADFEYASGSDSDGESDSESFSSG